MELWNLLRQKDSSPQGTLASAIASAVPAHAAQQKLCHQNL